eukprot:CAMPEP_0197641078 /NCGR_PEP_ID=MMETSP1338-20131121/15142_1 /TAXON_ID=43686 ORGANISM="Pelagodinium beii, Strain RCC1491" /NCGR_SAMPLE_ID=MMETSP1338 /ASSEMBLY_ACC=CAM_ASM_000754 /LENGTH=264 /DNA_ID=CAMNT_0043213983 /DNA_START=42 /DNA_END=836 /DNA_ORIENTATION=-
MSNPAPKQEGRATDEVRCEPSCKLLSAGCTEAVQILCKHGLEPALLNFAHGYNCGGGFEHSGGSQEEAIFRASSIFLSLWPHRRSDDGPGVLTRGTWIGEYDKALPRKEPFYQHTECGGIYSPHVRLVRDCRGRGDGPLFESKDVKSLPTFAVLTAAAQDVNREGSFNQKLLYEKARSILHIAACNGHETLVLGAFGCGYFRNPPGAVAEVFQDLLVGEFAASFSLVVFAIPDSHGADLTEFASKFPVISEKELATSIKFLRKN